MTPLRSTTSVRPAAAEFEPIQVGELTLAPEVESGRLLGINVSLRDQSSGEVNLQAEIRPVGEGTANEIWRQLAGATSRRDFYQKMSSLQEGGEISCTVSLPGFIRRPFPIEDILLKADPKNFPSPIEKRDERSGMPTKAALMSDTYLAELSSELDLSKGALVFAIDGRGWGIRNSGDRQCVDEVIHRLNFLADEALDGLKYRLHRRGGDEFVLIMEGTEKEWALHAAGAFFNLVDAEYRDLQKTTMAMLDSEDRSGGSSSRYQNILDRVDYELAVKEQMKSLQARYEKEATGKSGAFSRDSYLAFLEKLAAGVDGAQDWIGKDSVGALELVLSISEVEQNQFNVPNTRTLFSASVALTPPGEILTAELIHRALGLADKAVHEAKREGKSVSFNDVPVLTDEIVSRGSFLREKANVQRMCDKHTECIEILRDTNADALSRAHATLLLRVLDVLDPTTVGIHAKRAQELFLGEVLGFSDSPRSGTAIRATIANPSVINNAGRDGYEGTDQLVEYLAEQLSRLGDLGSVVRSAVGEVSVSSVGDRAIPIDGLAKLQEDLDQKAAEILTDRVAVELERRISLDAWRSDRSIKGTPPSAFGPLITLTADTGVTYFPELSLEDYFAG